MTRAKQLELPLKKSHGGRRAGAGRPNRSGLQAHVRRPKLNPRHPVHVTLRLRDGLPSLRKKETFRCLKHAVRLARQQGFFVAQFAILSNHIHLILEPRDASLGRVFQSLCISFAKRLNGTLKRTGQVFRERYHVHVLRTPSEVRRALAYVLTNEARHLASREARNKSGRILTPGTLTVRMDPFSSAYSFRSWKALFGRTRVEFDFSAWSDDVIEAWLEEILVLARTWLLTRGWLRAPAELRSARSSH